MNTAFSQHSFISALTGKLLKFEFSGHQFESHWLERKWNVCIVHLSILASVPCLYYPYSFMARTMFSSSFCVSPR